MYASRHDATAALELFSVRSTFAMRDDGSRPRPHRNSGLIATMDDGRRAGMPSPCTVCLRPDRAAIDRRLVREGANLAALARTLEVGRKSLERHRDRHVSQLLARVYEDTSTWS